MKIIELVKNIIEIEGLKLEIKLKDTEILKFELKSELMLKNKKILELQDTERELFVKERIKYISECAKDAPCFINTNPYFDKPR